MSLHLFQVLHVGFIYNLSEEQQNFSLPVGQGIPFDVVGVIVKLQHEFAVQSIFIFRL